MKKMSVIMDEYKKSGIVNESAEMYNEVKKVFKEEMKHTDKVERKYDEQAKEKRTYEKKHKECKAEMKKLREKYPVQTKLALIPIVGRFGKVAKEYNRLRRKAKRAKLRMKLAKRSMKDLEPVCKKMSKQLKLTSKDLKRCEKALKRSYKEDKANIEIAKMFKEKEDLLRKTYRKESFERIEQYVKKVRSGEKDVELPKGIDSQEDLMKKIKSDLKSKMKGKEVKQFVPEEKKNESKDDKSKAGEVKTDKANDTKTKSDNSMIFAKKGMSVRRDFVSYKEESNGTKIKLSPEETLSFIGLISKNPEAMEKYSTEQLANEIKQDQEFNLANRGWYALHDMIEDLKDKNTHIDVKKLNKSEKVIYDIAKKYIEKEEKAKEKAQKQNEKDTQQVQGA